MDVQRISCDLIDPPLLPGRLALEGPELEELVEDIRDRGLLQPLVVNRYAPEAAAILAAGDLGAAATAAVVPVRYRIMAGYRRFRACQRAGLAEVPCHIQSLTEAEEVAVTLRENLKRLDFTPVEEGILYQTIHETQHLTATGIAELVGKSRDYVLARMTLMEADEPLIRAVQEKLLTFSVALELLRCEHPEDRKILLYHALHQGCTASTARLWVEDYRQRRATLPPQADPAQAVGSAEAPPVILADCEWCGGKTPLATRVPLQFCPACREFLVTTRDRLAREAAAPEGGDRPVPG